MENRTSIKQFISDIASKCQISPSVIEGSISSSSPLKVTLTNDAKMVLTSTDLVVPERLKSHLGKGTKVYLLVFNNGKRFYILDIV